MTTGKKIAKLRNKKNMTQEDLADKMQVSRQTIYKWENDIVFPTKDNLTDLVRILETNYDYLLSEDKILDDSFKKESIETNTNNNGGITNAANITPTTPQTTVNGVVPGALNQNNNIPTPDTTNANNNVITPQPQVPLYTCSKCNKLIYKEEEAKKITVTSHSGRRRRGHHRHKKTSTMTLCLNCYQKRQQEKEEQARREEQANIYSAHKRFVKNFVFGALAAIVVLVIGISGAILAPEYQALYIWIATLGTIITYTFTGCMFLYNNVVVTIFLTVASWGFVKMPGIIFGSIGDLIVAKIVLTILSFFLAAFAVVFAFLISAFISVFVYPYAIYKNRKYPSKIWDLE